MPLAVANRIRETCSSPGTGAVTLLGAVTGFQSFAVIGNGNTTFYCIADQSGANWEVGLGTYSTTGPTLTRTTPYSGSSATPVNFSAGTQDVFVMLPSEQAVYLDAADVITGYAISGGTINNTIIGGTTPAAITGTNIASATAPTNTVPALALTGTPNNAAGAKTGVLAVGPNFTASDKNIIASFVQNINDYTQIVIQNPNAGATASSDVVINNDNTTGSGTYGDLGINSSVFSGTGSLGLPNATYLYSNGGDITFGTNTANAVHFVTNAGATDAGSISSAGRWAINAAGTNTTSTALLHLGAGTATASTAPLKFTAGTNLTAAEAGTVEYDGAVRYFTSDTTSGRGYTPTTQIFRLAANVTAFGPAIGNFFGANSAINLAAGGIYEIEAYCYFLKTTAGTVTVTATTSLAPANLSGYVQSGAIVGGTATGAANQISLFNSTATAAAFGASGSLTTAVNHAFTIRLLVEANASASNLRINFTSSAGTVTPLRTSYYKVTRLPVANTGSFAA